MNKFARRLTELRKGAGLSQEEFAVDMAVARMTINNYETGKRTPDLSVAVEMAEYFGVSLDFLCGLSNCPNLPTLMEVTARGNSFPLLFNQSDCTEVLKFEENIRHLLEKTAETDTSSEILYNLNLYIETLNALLETYTANCETALAVEIIADDESIGTYLVGGVGDLYKQGVSDMLYLNVELTALLESLEQRLVMTMKGGVE